MQQIRSNWANLVGGLGLFLLVLAPITWLAPNSLRTDGVASLFLLAAAMTLVWALSIVLASLLPDRLTPLGYVIVGLSPVIAYQLSVSVMPGVVHHALWPGLVLGALCLALTCFATLRVISETREVQQAVVEAGENPPREAVTVVRVRGTRMVAWSTGDHDIQVVDPETNDIVAVLSGHRDEVLALTQVEVGGRTLLASAGRDTTVRLWDPETLAELRVFEGHYQPVHALCTLATDKGLLLVSAGDDKTIRLWDPATGHTVQILEGHQHWVRALCSVNLRGEVVLATAGDDARVRLWNPITGTEVRNLEDPYADISMVRSAEHMMAHATPGTKTRFHQDPNQDIPATGPEPDDDEFGAALYTLCEIPQADGPTLVAAAGEEQIIRIWDAESGKLLHRITGHHDHPGLREIGGGTVYGLAHVHANRQDFLLSAGDFPGVWAWDIASGEQIGYIGWGGELGSDYQLGWLRGLCIAENERGSAVCGVGHDAELGIVMMER